MTAEEVRPYAIVGVPTTSRLDVSGVPGLDATLIAAGRVGAWVSCVALETRSQEELLAHHRVVDAVSRLGPCLPVRFGMLFASHEELRVALLRHEDQLISQLVQVGWKRELAITLEWVDLAAATETDGEPPSGTLGPGTRYLAQRWRHYDAEDRRRMRAEALTQELQAAFGSSIAVEDVKLRICPAARIALSCAVLIKSASAGDVMQRVRSAAVAWQDVRLHLGGPWPPYTFSVLTAETDVSGLRSTQLAL